MKTVILATLLALTALQADDTVHYDKNEGKPSSISEPNHPNNDLYSK